jgi:hypothetical protein
MWITSLAIVLPTAEKPKGIINARLLPYDGANLLATGHKDVRAILPSVDAATTAMVEALIAEVKRQAGTESAPNVIQVSAPDPAKPVTAMIVFPRPEKPHRIASCFALAATDSTFATVLSQTMAEVARLGGLEVQA